MFKIDQIMWVVDYTFFTLMSELYESFVYILVKILPHS